MIVRHKVVAIIALVTAIVVAIPVETQASLRKVDQVFEDLARGHPDGVAAVFRYFPDIVGGDEAAKDRGIVRTFAVLVTERLGLVESYETTKSTDNSFVNAYIESANADLW